MNPRQKIKGVCVGGGGTDSDRFKQYSEALMN